MYTCIGYQVDTSCFQMTYFTLWKYCIYITVWAIIYNKTNSIGLFLIFKFFICKSVQSLFLIQQKMWQDAQPALELCCLLCVVPDSQGVMHLLSTASSWRGMLVFVSCESRGWDGREGRGQLVRHSDVQDRFFSQPCWRQRGCPPESPGKLLVYLWTWWQHVG